ncbi:MAG: CaiB/BaiF CoA-transferase family protein [Bacteroidota bacterium]
MNKTFNGLVVVELASVLAGPSVGMFFAELGAKVIKIENKKTGGDVTRTWKTKKEIDAQSSSSYYASINWGKQVYFLDYTNDDDYKHLVSLISEADVVISNFKKGDDFKFKLDDETLKKIKPNLIIAKINGFGADNDKVAYDVVLQAETGFMSMNGTKASGPLKMPVAFIDVLAAHQLKEGILVALLKKYKTNKGSVVEVSLFDAAIASLVNQASNYLQNEEIPQLIGSLHPNIAPYGETFTTFDGTQIVLAIGTNAQFYKLCELLNLYELAQNPDFTTNTLRVNNRTQLFEILNLSISQKKHSDLCFLLEQNKIPFGTIKNLKQVIDNLEADKFLKNNDNQLKSIKSSVFSIKDL